MKAARIVDIDDYRQPTRLSLVKSAAPSLGSIRPWMTSVLRYSAAGTAVIARRAIPVLTDTEGREEIEVHTRAIKNRRANAGFHQIGSPEEYVATNHERSHREDRKHARLMHFTKMASANAGLVGSISGAGWYLWEQPLVTELRAGSLVLGAIAGITGLVGWRSGAVVGSERAKKRTMSDQLLKECLANLGIPALTQKIGEVRQVGLDIDNKLFFQRTMRLPMRVTASEVMAQHSRFAGNLDIDSELLLLEKGDSESRLLIKISKVNQLAISHVWNPPDAVDVFGPIAVGQNAIGEAITLDIESALLVIGESGSGKSFALQLLLAIASLDPLAKLRLGAFASSGDFANVLPMIEQAVIGEGTQADVAQRGLEMIRLLNTECAVRGAVLERLGEKMVTRQLAERYEALRPLVCVFDEIQVLFASNRHAKAELLTLLSKCRKYGIRLIVATPRIDKGVIDTSFVGAFNRKLVFKTAKEWEGRELLGSTSEAEGLKPFHFQYKGEAVVAGASTRHQVRIFGADDDKQRQAVNRGIELRGGRIEAVPLVIIAHETPDYDLELLRRIEQAFPATPDQLKACPARAEAMTLKELADTLELDVDVLTATLVGMGLDVARQKNSPRVDGKVPSFVKGVWLSDIEELIERMQ